MRWQPHHLAIAVGSEPAPDLYLSLIVICLYTSSRHSNILLLASMFDLSSDTLKQIRTAILSIHNGRTLLWPVDADTVTLEQSLARLSSFQADACGFFNAAVTLHPCTITDDPRRDVVMRELTEGNSARGQGQHEASSSAEICMTCSEVWE